MDVLHEERQRATAGEFPFPARLIVVIVSGLLAAGALGAVVAGLGSGAEGSVTATELIADALSPTADEPVEDSGAPDSSSASDVAPSAAEVTDGSFASLPSGQFTYIDEEVVAWGAGYVWVRQEAVLGSGDYQFRVSRSPDGLAWEPVELDLDLTPETQVSYRIDGDVLVIVANTALDPTTEGNREVVVSVTTDLESWASTSLPIDQIGGPNRNQISVRTAHLALSQSRWFVSVDLSDGAGVLTSTAFLGALDGSLIESTLPEGSDNRELLGTPDGFVMWTRGILVDDEARSSAFALSSDGVSWSLAPAPDIDEVASVTAVGAGILVAGWAESPPEFSGDAVMPRLIFGDPFSNRWTEVDGPRVALQEAQRNAAPRDDLGIAAVLEIIADDWPYDPWEVFFLLDGFEVTISSDENGTESTRVVDEVTGEIAFEIAVGPQARGGVTAHEDGIRFVDEDGFVVLSFEANDEFAAAIGDARLAAYESYRAANPFVQELVLTWTTDGLEWKVHHFVGRETDPGVDYYPGSVVVDDEAAVFRDTVGWHRIVID